jgi:predicted nucleic acid-binding protein
MKGSIKKFVLADTGFWFAWFCESDSHHAVASELATRIEQFYLVLPWPTLYETLNTKFLRRAEQVARFSRVLKQPGIRYENDEPYREDAFKRTLQKSNAGPTGQNLSLVDVVMNGMLENTSLRIDYLATFNARDFRRACQRRNIEILDSI